MSLLAGYDDKDCDVDDNKELTQQDGGKKRTEKRLSDNSHGAFFVVIFT